MSKFKLRDGQDASNFVVMYRLVEEIGGQSLNPQDWAKSNIIEFRCTKEVNCKVYISIQLLLANGTIHNATDKPLPLVCFDLHMLPGVIRAYEWKAKLTEYYAEEEKYEFCYLAQNNSVIPFIEITYV